MANADLDRATVTVVGQRTALGLLGGFELLLANRSVPLPVGAQRLIALLALVGPRTREAAAAALWPGLADAQTRGCLRTSLWRLQHRLGLPLVVSADHRLILSPEVTLDTDQYVARAVRIIDGPAELPDSELALGRLVTGELLPGWDDEWVVFERERLRQLRLHALERLSVRFAVRRRYGLAMEAGMAAVRADPLRESAHRAVIKVHLAEGNLAQARHHYADFRRLLLLELQVEPSPQLAALVAMTWDPNRRSS